jgi:tape measure domain-containing protein
MGFGLSIEESRANLELLGNASQGSSAKLNGLAVVLGQIKGAGKMDAKDMLQFVNQGVPMLQLLQESLGKTAEEIKDLRAAGKISYTDVANALKKANKEGGMFYKGMERQSKTLNGVFSTLKDNITLALAKIGTSISTSFDLKGVADKVIKKVQALASAFDRLTPQQKKMAISIAAITAALPLLVLGLGAVASALASVMGLFAAITFPITVVIGVIATLVTGFALLRKATKNNGDTLKKYKKELNEVASGGAAPLISELDNLERKLIELKNEGKDFTEVQDALKESFGEHIESTDNLGSSYDELRGAINGARESVMKLAHSNAAISLTEQVDAELMELKGKKIALEFDLGIDPDVLYSTLESFQDMGFTAQKMVKELNKIGVNFSVKELLSFSREYNKDLNEQNALLEKRNFLESQIEAPKSPTQSETNKNTNGSGLGEAIADEDKELSILEQIRTDFEKESKELKNLYDDNLIDFQEYITSLNALQVNARKNLSKNGLSNTDFFKDLGSDVFASTLSMSLLDGAKADEEAYKRAEDRLAATIKRRKKIIAENQTNKNTSTNFSELKDSLNSLGSLFGNNQSPLASMFDGVAQAISNLPYDKIGQMFTDIKAKGEAAFMGIASAVGVVGSVASGIFDGVRMNIDENIKALDKEKEAKLNAIDELGLSQEAAAKHKAKVEEKAAKEEAKLKRKSAIANKLSAISQSIMNTALGVTSALSSIITAPLAPKIGILGGIQTGIIAAQPIPQFANGGIVSGRTLAEVGEYGSASRGNPEVIAPLDKLRSILSDTQGGNISGEFRLRGDDLVAAVGQANGNSARFSGSTQF